MAIAWEHVRDEVTQHLQELIRRNTVNPPGNETQAAEYLASVTEREGIETQIIESAPGRGNFVARIRGTGKARPLLLMAHNDTVSVEPEKWTHDPFGGEVHDGQIWGRGAVDTKDLVACELMVMLLSNGREWRSTVTSSWRPSRTKRREAASARIGCGRISAH